MYTPILRFPLHFPVEFHINIDPNTATAIVQLQLNDFSYQCMVLHALKQFWLEVTVHLETALTNRHALVMYNGYAVT
jgi:hypothetical protein